MTRSQRVTLASLLSTLTVVIIPMLIFYRFNLNHSIAYLVPSLITGGVIALAVNFFSMFTQGDKMKTLTLSLLIMFIFGVGSFLLLHNPFLFHPLFFIRYLVQCAVIIAVLSRVQNMEEPVEKCDAFPDDQFSDRRSDILKKWQKPEGIFDRFANVHPILGGIGALGALASVGIAYFAFSDLEMFLDVPAGEMAVYVLIPIGTIFYILLISGYLDELFFWSRNKLFVLVGGGFSIPKYIVVNERGETIRLQSKNWDDYTFELRLREKITHKKIHKYKSTSTNSIGRRKTTTHTWESLKVEYKREMFLDKPEKSGSGSSYDITVPPLSSVMVSRESRSDWVLGVKVKKGIFTWFKEIYLVPSNLL